MKDQKTRVLDPVTNEFVEGVYIKAINIPDLSDTINLDDGTILDFKVSINRITRISNRWDIDGNPFYLVQSGNSITIVNSPEHLRKENK